MANLTLRMRSWAVTVVTVILLGCLGLGVVAPPVAQAGAVCRVGNVTQRSHGTSFDRMVRAAHDGDRLWVRGTCEADVTIWTDLTITGLGGSRPVLTGRHRHGVLVVGRGATVVLRHLVVAEGAAAPGEPGAITNNGTLGLIDSVVRDNVAEYGGGIDNHGNLGLVDSVVRDNRAAWVPGMQDSSAGGGILNHRSAILIDSVVQGNAAADGGGIYSTGTTTLVDSVVRGNTASMGAGIYAQGRLTLSDSVVRGNAATMFGGGLYDEGTATLIASIVRDNTAPRGGGIYNEGALDMEQASRVTANTALKAGGGIWNVKGGFYGDATVTLESGSTVTGNTPDDCRGTPAC